MNKIKLLTIRLTADDYKRVYKNKKKYNCSMSSFIRMILKKELYKEEIKTKKELLDNVECC